MLVYQRTDKMYWPAGDTRAIDIMLFRYDKKAIESFN